MFRPYLVSITAALLLAVISTGNAASDAEPKAQLDIKKQLDELNSARAAIEGRYNPLVEKARTNATNAQTAAEKFRADSLSIAAKFVNDTIAYRHLSIDQVPSDGKFLDRAGRSRGRRGQDAFYGQNSDKISADSSPRQFAGEIFENADEILDIGQNITTAKVGDLLPNKDGNISVLLRLSQQAAGGGMSVQSKMYLITKLYVKTFSRFPTALDDVRARQTFVQLYWPYAKNLPTYETAAKKGQDQQAAIENEERQAIETWDSPNGAKLRALQDQMAPPAARTLEKQQNIAAGATPSASAEQPLDERTIEPYGGLSWDDGFYQVVCKLQKLPGIERILINGRDTDIKGIRSESEIYSLIAKSWGNDFGAVLPQIVGNDISARDTTPYKDALGNEKRLLRDPRSFITELLASPIVLGGHPFKMHVNFLHSIGYAVKYPDRVFRFAKYPSAIIPLAICEVSLTSETDLSKDSQAIIHSALVEKYGSLNSKLRQQLDDHLGIGKAKDSRGAELCVCIAQRPIAIRYIYSRRDLQKFYEEHLTELDKKSVKKKPDGTRGL
ncbi:MAG: hypothetical protein NTY01_09720 [Verrucomicrobia bacterium]|nr:hypothetical protein [Verrucomicrobiota bacterium]